MNQGTTWAARRLVHVLDQARRAIATCLVVGLALLLAPAAAQATLLVRSDGAGLAVTDKNNLNDNVFIYFEPSVYNIINGNVADVFKFDRQLGCVDAGFARVSCTRNGPVVQVGLAGGDDRLLMEPAIGVIASVGTATVGAGAGNDFVNGHGGADEIHGFTGNDNFLGDGGADKLLGEDGSDRLEGENGNDRLEGGPGNDVLIGGPGADILVGGSSNDFIDSKEDVLPAEADTLACGSGFDSVEADALQDTVQSTCEVVTTGPIGETPNVRAQDLFSDGRMV